MKKLIDNDLDNFHQTEITRGANHISWFQFELSKEVVVTKVLIFNRKDQVQQQTIKLLLRVGYAKVDLIKHVWYRNRQLNLNARCSEWRFKEGETGEQIDMRCHEGQQGNIVSIQTTDTSIRQLGFAEVHIYGKGFLFIYIS